MVTDAVAAADQALSTSGVSDAASHPTARVVLLLDLFVRHPSDAFGLSELARMLDMNKSTCLNILTTLTDCGYLIQHPKRRTYRIGPTLVGAGRAATLRFPDLVSVHPILERGAVALNAAINVVSVADDQIVVLDSVGRVDPGAGFTRVGVQLPFVPPYGSGFVAWGGEDEFSQWVRRSDSPISAERQERLSRSVAASRERGFVVALEVDQDDVMVVALAQLRWGDRRVDLRNFGAMARSRLDGGYLLDDIAGGRQYQLNLIHAPVHISSTVPLALVMAPFGRSMAGSEIAAAGERLVCVAREVAEVLAA